MLLDVKLVTATATKTSRYRAYSNLFNSSIVGRFFQSLIPNYCIKVQEKKKKVVVLCSRPRQNVKNEPLSRGSRAVTAKKCTKSVMHVQSCCFANLNLLFFFFLPFSFSCVGTAHKVSPDWSHKTMTSFFQLFQYCLGQGQAPLVTLAFPSSLLKLPNISLENK